MLKYGVSRSEELIISEFKQKYDSMSIFLLMRKLKCTPEKAAYILHKYFTAEKEKIND